MSMGGAGLLGTAWIAVTAKNDGLIRGLAQAEGLLSSAFHRMQSLAARSAKTIFSPLIGAANGFQRAWKNALLSSTGMGGMSGGLNAGGLSEMFKAAVHQASSLAESTSKVGFTFQDDAKKITGAADEMAKKFGINRRVFIDSATNIGMIAKGAGLAKGPAAEMGASFAKLAADVASFDNVPVEEAMRSIRAGLVGESEPLRRFGVMLTEAAVKEQALSMGAKLVNGHLDEQSKMLARAALITKGLADRQGDLERTAGSYENRMRQISGAIENLEAKIGMFLLPALSRLSGVFAMVIQDIDTYMTRNKKGFDAWAESVADNLGYVEVAYKNMPLAWEVVQEVVHEKMLHMNQVFKWLKDNAGAIFEQMMRDINMALARGFDKSIEIQARFLQKFGFGDKNKPIGKVHVFQDREAARQKADPIKEIPPIDFIKPGDPKNPNQARAKFQQIKDDKWLDDWAARRAGEIKAEADEDERLAKERQKKSILFQGGPMNEPAGPGKYSMLNKGQALQMEMLNNPLFGALMTRGGEAKLHDAASQSHIVGASELAKDSIKNALDSKREDRELKMLGLQEKMEDHLAKLLAKMKVPGMAVARFGAGSAR